MWERVEYYDLCQGAQHANLTKDGTEIRLDSRRNANRGEASNTSETLKGHKELNCVLNRGLNQIRSP